MFSRFYANNTKLGRWRHTGLPCSVKIENCSHFQWDDYSCASNMERLERKLAEIDNKKRQDKDLYFKETLS